MTGLVVRDVGLVYGDVTVLTGVSLEVHAGEVVALLGANGSGKSTLLRGIAGLLSVAAGTVTLAGQRLDGLAPHLIVRRGLSLVPETRQLFANLSTLENLRLGAYTMPDEHRWRERLEEGLAIFPELRPRLATPSWHLSSGEQQMVALARALMAKPTVLCLDDPFLGLSGQACERVEAALRRLVLGGPAVLAAGQHVRRLTALCDRAYLLADGGVRFSGTRAELDHASLARAFVL